MPPQNAWENIDNIIAQVALTREQRQAADMAMAILRPKIDPIPEPLKDV